MEAAMQRWNTLGLENIIMLSFLFRIFNFSLARGKKYSNVLVTNDQEWRVLAYPRGNYVDDLSLYLEVARISELPIGWYRLARYKFNLVNQFDDRRSITKETIHLFNKKEADWGFTSFIPLTVLKDDSQGYLVDDTCIIRAEISVPKSLKTLYTVVGTSSSIRQLGGGLPALPLNVAPARATSSVVRRLRTLQLNAEPAHATSSVVPTLPVYAEPARATSSTVPTVPVNTKPSRATSSAVEPICAASAVVKEESFLSSLPTGEVENFRGFGEIDKAFIPLLEEVCSSQPSVVECMKEQCEQFTQWAFTTLGRMLHFLNMEEPEKLTDQYRLDLKALWSELQIFNFDLRWLEEDYERALNKKRGVERTKRLREELTALKFQKRKLKTELVDVMAEIEEVEETAKVVGESIEGGLKYRTKLLEPWASSV